MSTAVVSSSSEVMSIMVFWQTTANGRRLPVSRQSWRYYLTSDNHTVEDLPVPAELLKDCEYMTELVVLVAEFHGLYIDAEQVRDNWPNRSATWLKGS